MHIPSLVVACNLHIRVLSGCQKTKNRTSTSHRWRAPLDEGLTLRATWGWLLKQKPPGETWGAISRWFNSAVEVKAPAKENRIGIVGSVHGSGFQDTYGNTSNIFDLSCHAGQDITWHKWICNDHVLSYACLLLRSPGRIVVLSRLRFCSWSAMLFNALRAHRIEDSWSSLYRPTWNLRSLWLADTTEEIWFHVQCTTSVKILCKSGKSRLWVTWK